jgi:hypothetical protein
MLATFDPPTVPKVPKHHSTKKDFRATSLLMMPKRVPPKKPVRHGHSGDLGGLGGGQVGRNFEDQLGQRDRNEPDQRRVGDRAHDKD